MQKIETELAPRAIGPYSQAVFAGDFLFLSGQIPLDPKTGEVVEGGIEKQTERVLLNIAAILKAKDLTLKHVIRAEVYLKDMGDFSEMNKVYERHFSHEVKPARHAFAVAKLPLDSLVEISCIAYAGL